MLPLDLKTVNGDNSRDEGGKATSDDGRDAGGTTPGMGEVERASGTAAESNGRFRHPCLARHLCFLHVAGSSCRNSRRGVSGVPH
ncbi:MAG: hypothetical protein HY083_05940 [Gammaproteobacteria bacterium]|nr:hypothetical protein [Gammaproteobacteria bacterium]